MWWRLDETPYVTKKSRIQRNGCGRIGAVFVGDSLKESLHAEDETMRVTVEKLAATEHYAKIRRNSDSQLQAIHSYATGM